MGSRQAKISTEENFTEENFKRERVLRGGVFRKRGGIFREGEFLERGSF